MKIDEDIAKLICELEFIIGDQCYNPNSYDGWTGDEGCSYRYPVNIYPNSDAEEPVKVRGKVTSDISYKWHNGEIKESNIRSMKYKFGSNHLFIGDGLIKALEYLEDRYNIDFNELEKKIKNKE